MKLYLDTANLAEIKEIAAWGVLAGLTTNPSLLAKEKIPIADFMAEVKKDVAGPLSLEVLGDTAEAMVKDAESLTKYGENVVIKLPMSEEGLKAQRMLKQQGVNTNMTLVFSANQAMLAAAGGASYVSPFVGRVDDIGAEGKDLVREIKTIFKAYEIKTEVIAASIRSPRDVTDAAVAGADIATIPYGIFKKMAAHPLTEIGIARFKEDWENSGLQV